MHTNGGDRWIVWDRMWDKAMTEPAGQAVAKYKCDELNTSADFYCYEPRFTLKNLSN